MFLTSYYIFNFIRCSIEQQPHKKQLKQSNNTGVSRTRLSDK